MLVFYSGKCFVSGFYFHGCSLVASSLQIVLVGRGSSAETCITSEVGIQLIVNWIPSGQHPSCNELSRYVHKKNIYIYFSVWQMCSLAVKLAF